MTLRPVVSTPDLVRELFFTADTPQQIVDACFDRLQDESYPAYLDTMLFALARPRRVTAPVLVLGAEKDGVFTIGEVRRTARAYRSEAGLSGVLKIKSGVCAGRPLADASVRSPGGPGKRRAWQGIVAWSWGRPRSLPGPGGRDPMCCARVSSAVRWCGVAAGGEVRGSPRGRPPAPASRRRPPRGDGA